MSERVRRLEYSKAYDIPTVVIEALQEMQILPQHLPPVQSARLEDDAFLKRYSLVLGSHQLIRSGLAKYDKKDRLVFIQKTTPGWEAYVRAEYVKCYRLRTNRSADEEDIHLPTQDIYVKLQTKYDIVVTSEVRKKVDTIRRAAFRQVTRENEKV